MNFNLKFSFIFTLFFNCIYVILKNNAKNYEIQNIEIRIFIICFSSLTKISQNKRNEEKKNQIHYCFTKLSLVIISNVL